MMRLLLVDNYDSFTFNLAHLIGAASGTMPRVVKNDEIDLDDVLAFAPDAVFISPGPGRPDRRGDFGICGRLIQTFEGPLLGVCLGHQGLAAHLGGQIDYADQVMHGRPSRIRHDGAGLFDGIPQDFEATRYHSLLVTDPGPQLLVTARAEDGAIMGLQHRSRPLFGVQFHPESITTEHGLALVRNFLRVAVDVRSSTPVRTVLRKEPPPSARPCVFTHTIGRLLDPERCFAALYGCSGSSFWLDSASVGSGLSNWSFMGDASGPLAERVTYRVAERVVYRDGETTAETIFEALARWLPERRVERPDGLTVPFLPGWVGYFGYELKADAGAAAGHRSDLPDAQLVFADRIVAFDHRHHQVVLLALDFPEHEARAQSWFAQVRDILETAPALPDPGVATGAPVFQPFLDDAGYLQRIAAAKDAIRRGESYEICLTNEFVAETKIDPFPAYRRLRRSNPAPFAAYLRFDELAVLSSSPERFLKIDGNGQVEARPIKGTVARGQDPCEDIALAEQLRSSVKDRSEHLMIVDLLRNDLSRVCAPGSVTVPHLFVIEPYATVHQMVSTVRGQLNEGVSPIACIQAAFPGGSMTGAPKLRTMAILDKLEGRPRGIYSGAIGYIGLDGQVDLSIVIRTAVCHGGQIRIGAGGAIIDLSDPALELAEVRLKCGALIRAFGGTIADTDAGTVSQEGASSLVLSRT